MSARHGLSGRTTRMTVFSFAWIRGSDPKHKVLRLPRRSQDDRWFFRWSILWECGRKITLVPIGLLLFVTKVAPPIIRCVAA